MGYSLLSGPMDLQSMNNPRIRFKERELPPRHRQAVHSAMEEPPDGWYIEVPECPSAGCHNRPMDYNNIKEVWECEICGYVVEA